MSAARNPRFAARLRGTLHRWWPALGLVMVVGLVAVIIILVDQQRIQSTELAQTREDEQDFLTNLFGDEQVIALLHHQGQVRIWRPGSTQVQDMALTAPEAQRLVQLLTSSRSYDRHAPLQPSAARVMLRCDDATGSLTLAFCLDTALLCVYWNGNVVGQASFAPALVQIRTVLDQLCPFAGLALPGSGIKG